MALSRKGKIIIGATAAVLILIIIIVSVLATRKDTPEVTIVEVKSKPVLKSTVTAPGEVRPIQYINLTSEVQGRIEQIYVKEGDKVEEGTQLVKLDPSQLQSGADAQLAAYQAAQDDSAASRSQVTAAQNQLSQAQQGLIASEAAITTAQQSVNSAQENVNQARQRTIASQTEVDRTQVELNAANRELKRNEELLESGVISRLEYDQAKDRVATAQVAVRNAQANLDAQRAAVKVAQQQVNEAQARVKEARARANQQEVAVKDARRGVQTAGYSADASTNRAQQQFANLRAQRDQRDKTLQLAPISGVIADIPSKVGTFATANLSSTPLLTIADMSTVNVEVKVNEAEIDNVAVGQTATIKVDTFGEKELVGEVTQKTPLAVGQSQTSGGLSSQINVQESKDFRVVIQLKELPEEIKDGLRPGMSATAVITTKTVKDTVAVPIQAVIEKRADASPTPSVEGDAPKPTPEGEKPKPIKGVFINDNGRAKFIEVETGITGETEIQITSGLSEGMNVITGPSRILNKLKEGDVVKIQTKKEGDNSAGS